MQTNVAADIGPMILGLPGRKRDPRKDPHVIEHFAFGEIVIDGTRYDSDVLIHADGRIDASWRRVEGHLLRMEDIRGLLEGDPKAIIAGTGANGMMRPEHDLESRLRDAGIGFEARPTEEAARLFNARSAEGGVAACFHLTC